MIIRKIRVSIVYCWNQFNALGHYHLLLHASRFVLTQIFAFLLGFFSWVLVFKRLLCLRTPFSNLLLIAMIIKDTIFCDDSPNIIGMLFPGTPFSKFLTRTLTHGETIGERKLRDYRNNDVYSCLH